jgi:hypothetical protein
MSDRITLRFAAPGPVAEAFMRDRSAVPVINGPVGSGKTTASIMKAVKFAAEQQPSTLRTAPGPDGRERWKLRRFKLCVVRDTYRQLWRSTMQSWFSRFPRTLGVFTGAENAPAAHTITFALSDRTWVELHADFVAIGDQSVEEVLRGYEPTAFYLNELDMLAREVFTYAAGRTGRFPPMDEGGPSWHGIIADCNAPVLDSWLYEDIFMSSPAELAARGIALFRQPGGRDPGAENLPNLPGGRAYYDRQAAINSGDPGYVSRMVDNKPGFSRAGKPIYGAEYNDLVHCRPVEAVKGRKLIIGLDAGLSPAAMITQRHASGLVLWRAELVSDPGTGPRRFGGMLAQFLRERFPDWEVEGVCDPSALYGADKKAGDKDWSEIVAAETGIRIRPAPSNNPTVRWEAVRRPMTTLIDGQPGFALHPDCKVARSGFNAGYRFRAIAGTTGRYSEEAEKTRESHVHDAGQYANLYGGEDREIRKRRGDDTARMARLPSSSPPWDPYSTAAGAS